MLLGIFAGALFTAFIVYPPFMWEGIGTNYVPPLLWLIPIACGMLNFAYAVVRLLIRKRLNILNVGYDGDVPLDMHPTVWSTRYTS
jgi:lipid-A-disaccharide synthase-like uncharacterized protein